MDYLIKSQRRVASKHTFLLWFLFTIMWLLFPLLFVLHSVWALRYSFRDYDYYVLELDPYVGSSLSQVAGRLGVQVVERAGELDNLWVVRAPKRHPSTSLGSRGETRDPIFSALNSLRTSLSARDPDAHIAHRMAASVKYLARQELRQRAKRAPPPIRPGNDSSKHPLAQAVVDRLDIQDPLFLQQWHLVNEEFPEHMMNVTRLWDMGITGAGVVTAIVDDGLDYDHEDLADNFVSVSLCLTSCLRPLIPPICSGHLARTITTTMKTYPHLN
jgi:kexin